MPAVAPLHPFLFDRDFGGDVAPLPVTPVGAAESAPASELEQKLAEARAEGFAHGHRAGFAEAGASIEQYLAHAIDAVRVELASLGAVLREREEALRRQSAALATIICRKFLPSRYHETAVDEITGLVAAVLPRVIEVPKVTVRVAENLVDPLAQRLNALARTVGYPGLIETIGDIGVAPGDCRIEWPRGGAVRDSATLWREIDALMEEALGSLSDELTATNPDVDNPQKRVCRNV